MNEQIIFLVDSSVFIKAKNQYYQMERIPEFWRWIDSLIKNGNIRVPYEIFGELTKGNDNLSKWVKYRENLIVLDEEILNLAIVLRDGYGLIESDLNETDWNELGKDPFLILYAMFDKQNRIVVSSEVSKKTATGIKSRIPDVCEKLGIRHFSILDMISELDFRTSDWK